MNFNLDKDIVFFDLEATGLNVVRDRIVQIALIKYTKNNPEPQELEMMINPGIPISQEAIQVHGITPNMVRNKPTFAQVAEEIYNFIGDADLSGYNSDRFDIPMLMEEFYRAGIDFSLDKRKLIDVQKIFYKMEPRTLKAAYKFFCGEKLENAHDALADVRATVAVLKGQITRYQDEDYEDADGNVTTRPVQNDMKSIAEFIKDNSTVDVTQKLKYNADGVIVFNFGKYAGQPAAKLLYEDRQYLNWILDKEFSAQVKQTVKRIVKEYAQSLKK